MASQARLREALNAGGPGTKAEKGPPVADGVLSVTPDTPEAVEWRSRRSAIDCAGTSSSYLDDDEGPQPSELYGKFTWKIENFSEITKRELRSTVFEVGNYKWYILVYPQGCDVCNHLSLFLCVADYDKLLPGWSHFAQFTIAVVNKDPKKSKYSDTLHRFCKKEHDWGWKKFMELSKVLEGFTVSDTLVIKAQVQVIRDKLSMPFRCLDPQYRRELVRVYLTNVEGVCRRFVEEKRERFQALTEDHMGFKTFWQQLDSKRRKSLVQDRGEAILKGIVKRFFNEKEVTSTLVMDALYSGCKQIEESSRHWLKGKGKGASPPILIDAGKSVHAIGGDLQHILEKAANESIPTCKDDKGGDTLALRNAQDSDDYSKDSVERDERRLAELGRRTVETYILAHVISERIEAAHSEAESIKRQDELIREEEEHERAEDERLAARAAVEKEKRMRKKEKKKAKKEAERAKREAEEAVRRAQEEGKREEEKRRSREAEEKRRQQEAAAHARKADLSKLRISSPSAASARSKADGDASSAALSIAQTSIDTRASASSGHDSDGAGTTGRNAGEATSSTPTAQRVPSYAAASSEAEQRGLSDDGSTSAISSSEDASPSTSFSLADEQVLALHEQVRWLESQLAERDAEVVALRAQIADRPLELHPFPSTTSTLSGHIPEVSSTHSSISGSSHSPSRASSLDLSSAEAARLQSASRPESRDGAETARSAVSLENGSVSGGPVSLQHGFRTRSVNMDPPAASSGTTVNGGRPASRHPAASRSSSSSSLQAGVGLYSASSLPLAGADGSLAGPQRSARSMTHKHQPASPHLLKDKAFAQAQRTGSVPALGNGPSRPGGKHNHMQHAQHGQHASHGHPSHQQHAARHAGLGTGHIGKMLNGAATAFVPASQQAATPVANGGSGVVANGAASYRNAAAGMASNAPAMSVPSSPLAKSMGLKNTHSTAAAATEPKFPAALLMHQPPNLAFSSPMPSKRADRGPADSPGLDDFAHMGLITDLLE